MAKASVVVGALMVLAMAHLMLMPAWAINCVDVDMALHQCIPHLTGQAAEPAAVCCDGISHLKDIAATTPDKCNVPLPYPISASVDCTKIQ